MSDNGGDDYMGGGGDIDYEAAGWVAQLEMWKSIYSQGWPANSAMGNTFKCDTSLQNSVRDNDTLLQDEDMPLPTAVDENEDQMFDSAQGLLNGARTEDMDMQDATPGSQPLLNGNAASSQTQQQVHSNTEPRKPNKVRITTPYLTKYERARVLGTRALQIRWASFTLFARQQRHSIATFPISSHSTAWTLPFWCLQRARVILCKLQSKSWLSAKFLWLFEDIYQMVVLKIGVFLSWYATRPPKLLSATSKVYFNCIE
jgi:hypothetical protein